MDIKKSLRWRVRSCSSKPISKGLFYETLFTLKNLKLVKSGRWLKDLASGYWYLISLSYQFNSLGHRRHDSCFVAWKLSMERDVNENLLKVGRKYVGSINSKKWKYTGKKVVFKG